MIISIHQIELDEDNQVYVKALIEDAELIQPQTWEDPAEYGPGVCESSFTLDEDDILPDNEYELIEFLENLDLTWDLIVDEDEYYGDDISEYGMK